MNLQYNIKYTNRKTVNISIDPNKVITVCVPLHMSRKDIENIIEKKKIWIFEKLKMNNKNIISAKEFVSGENFLFLGKSYILKYVDDNIENVLLENEFKISNKYKSNSKILLDSFYKIEAKKIFAPLVENYANLMGVVFNKFIVKKLNKSWGSCSPNRTITLNYQIVKAPIFVIKYIIVHELAHIKELNHSKTFWNMVYVQVPNYKKAQSWLKVQGNEILK